MARHAGFAVVASIRQGEINSQLESFFTNVGPFFFPLPQTINVGGVPVTFAGVMQVAAPVVELHPNPQDLITVHFAFFSTLNARVAGGQPRKWTVRLDTTVTGRLILAPLNGQITLRLDTSTVVFQPLTVTILSGPPPPPPLINALQSPDLAAAATAIVQSLPPVTLAGLAPAQFTHTQPGTFKDSNFSVFNWFTISLTVNRTVLRVFEGAVTIAADFAGITNGNRNELVDLTRTHGGGNILVQTITETSDPVSPPIPVPRSYKPASDIALTFNIGVLSHILEHQVSPQIAGTPVSKQAVLNWIRAGYSWFEKPLRGHEHGLEIRIGATAKGVDADINVYLQPFIRTFDGPTNFIRPDQGWLIYVARVDIDLPWWADLAIGMAQVLSVAALLVLVFPAMLNQLILGVQAGLLPMKVFEDLLTSINDKFAKSDPSNIAAAQQLTLQKGVYDARIPLVRYLSISPGGIDIGRGTGTEGGFALPSTPTGGASITPVVWSVYDTNSIMTALQLDPNWQKLNQNNLQVIWEVRRKRHECGDCDGYSPVQLPWVEWCTNSSSLERSLYRIRVCGPLPPHDGDGQRGRGDLVRRSDYPNRRCSRPDQAVCRVGWKICLFCQCGHGGQVLGAV